MCGVSSIKPHGVDISKSAVELAIQRVPDGRFWVSDITQQPLSEKYDLVVCSEVLEHIPDDITTIRNLRQMTGRYPHFSAQGPMRRFERYVGHVRNYAPGEFVQRLEQNGFMVNYNRVGVPILFSSVP